MTHKLKLILLALVAAFCAVYSYIWFLSANAVETALLAEIKRLEEKDYTIDYGSLHVKGFPFKIDIEVDNLYIKSPAKDGSSPVVIMIQEKIHGTAAFYDPQKVFLSVKKSDESADSTSPENEIEKSSDSLPIRISLVPSETSDAMGLEKPETLLMTAGQLRAEIDLSVTKSDIPDDPQTFPENAIDLPRDLQHTLIQARLIEVRFPTFETVTEKGEKRPVADEVTFRMIFDPEDSFENTYSLDIDTLHLAASPMQDMPKTIRHISLKLSLKGDIKHNLPLDKAIQRWYDTDGMIEIKELIAEWGDLKIAGSGSFSLDGVLQPLASFSMDIFGINTVLELLNQNKKVNPFVVNLIKTALNDIEAPFIGITKLEKLNAVGDGKIVYHKISLSTQDNELILGTVPIFKYNPIDWCVLGQHSLAEKHPINASIPNSE